MHEITIPLNEHALLQKEWDPRRLQGIRNVKDRPFTKKTQSLYSKSSLTQRTKRVKSQKANLAFRNTVVESPDLYSEGLTWETEWLSQRASVALSELLSSLRIDPKIVSFHIETESMTMHRRSDPSSEASSEGTHCSYPLLNKRNLRSSSHPFLGYRT